MRLTRKCRPGRGGAKLTQMDVDRIRQYALTQRDVPLKVKIAQAWLWYPTMSKCAIRSILTNDSWYDPKYVTPWKN